MEVSAPPAELLESNFSLYVPKGSSFQGWANIPLNLSIFFWEAAWGWEHL